MPGMVCTLARTGTVALRVMPPAASPGGATRRARCPRCRAATTPSSVSSRLKVSICVAICVAIAAQHAVGDALGDVPRELVRRAASSSPSDPVARVGGGGVEQRGMLRAVLVDHDRADGERHRDGRGDGDGDVFALEADDGHGDPDQVS